MQSESSHTDLSCLSLFIPDPGLDRRDPRWVGAWWLGFVICAACSLLPAFPLALFPRNLKKQTPAEIEAEKNAMDLKNNLKGTLQHSPNIIISTFLSCPSVHSRLAKGHYACAEESIHCCSIAGCVFQCLYQRIQHFRTQVPWNAVSYYCING